MRRYLLDTNIVSELRKVEFGRADAGVASWSRSVNAADLYLSVVSLQELETGVLRLERRDHKQGAILRRWFAQRVLPAFERRLLPMTPAIALAAAKLHVPNPRSFQDSVIAATAIVHGMVMVTRNVTDFAPLGVELLNPFEAKDSSEPVRD